MMSITPDTFSTIGRNRRKRENTPKNQSRANAAIKNGMASPKE